MYDRAWCCRCVSYQKQRKATLQGWQVKQACRRHCHFRTSKKMVAARGADDEDLDFLPTTQGTKAGTIDDDEQS